MSGPKAGETIFHCGHAMGAMMVAILRFDEPIQTLHVTPDGVEFVSGQWLALCGRCQCAGGNPLDKIGAHSTLTGDLPVFVPENN